MMIAKERPVVFNSRDVRAILEGRKTQFRKIVKQPKWSQYDMYLDEHGMLSVFDPKMHSDSYVPCPFANRCDIKVGPPMSVALASGTRLWVKESLDGLMGCDARYNADYERIVDAHPRGWDVWDVDKRSLPCGTVYAAKMPRWACRIFLEVMQVRAQRLQDINASDAILEGLETIEPGLFQLAGKPAGKTGNPVKAFISQWQSDHGEVSWEINPWVWVVDFKRVQPEPQS